METYPLPIVIVSAGWDSRVAAEAWRGVEAGALTALEKPVGLAHSDYERVARTLIQTVKLMSQVKVVRRWPDARREMARAMTPPKLEIDRPLAKAELVAIGASTGGPQALHTILSGLPRDFPAPIMIAQHIAPSFAEGFAHWLNESCPLEVRVGVQMEPLCPGHVYIAPAGLHMRVDSTRRISLGNGVAGNGPCPSVSSLFSSVIPVYGKAAVGVLLTGMGRDGAEELKLMKDKGAITIVQDRDSSVVHGMPGAALELGAEVHVLTPEEIAEKLQELV